LDRLAGRSPAFVTVTKAAFVLPPGKELRKCLHSLALTVLLGKANFALSITQIFHDADIASWRVMAT
jgi:hypothetical protein